MPQTSVAQQLLDAQVRHFVDRLSGEQLAQTISGLAGDLFDAAGEHQLADLIDHDAVKEVVTRSLATVPDSPAVSGILELVVEVGAAGPDEEFTVGELVDRDKLIALLDEVFALTPVLEQAMGRLSESPLVGTMASRFMGRIAGEVLATNQAIADKIPGLGSITRLGTSAATRVGSAANKQLEGLIGKGGTFAVQRLNRIVIDTINDDTTREAVIQVWDLIAAEKVTGLSRLATAEQISGVVDAGHALAVDTLQREHLARLAAALVDGFFDWFGGYTPTELLEQLKLDQADLVADLHRIAPGVAEAFLASGALEGIVRAQLEPFYSSAAVTRLLDHA